MVLFALYLVGCAEQAPTSGPSASNSYITGSTAQPRAPMVTSPEAVRPAIQSPQTVRRIGNDTFVNAAAKRKRLAPPIELSGTDHLTVNMFDVPVRQAAKAVLGDTLGLNYSVTDDAQGNVTVQTSNPVSRRDLFEIFQTVLASSGFALVRQNGVYVISKDLGGASQFRLAGGTVAERGGVYVVPLKYISAFEMMRILEPIVSSSLSLKASQGGNLLFANGGRGDIEAMLDAVNLFDVDYMQGKSVSRVPLRSASPSEVAAELEAVFDTEKGGSLEGVLKFLPNDTLGSILIISSRARYIAEAEKWIHNYDDAASANREETVVYKLENRSAVDLAPVINKLLSIGSLSVNEGAAPAAAAGGAPAPAAAAASPAAPPAGPGATPGGPTSGGTVTPEPLRVAATTTTKVVADDTSNTLIAVATPREQEEIGKLVKRLDSVAVQVLIEATIAEVTLNHNLQFGVRWFFEHGDVSAGFSPLDVAGVNPIFPGFNAILDAANIKVALHALQSVTDVNVVSSPTLLVLDNREAELNVGDQVPVVTQSAVSVTNPDAPIVNSVEQRDTGVILKIRPRVSSSGRVILDIKQEVSDVVPTITSGIDSPTIQQRLISTTVAVDNGQSVALGGLIRQTKSRKKSQVPILGDIPVLGALFRDKTNSNTRTELLVIITPRVISDASEARRITEEYRGRMSGPSSLVTPKNPTEQHQFREIFF